MTDNTDPQLSKPINDEDIPSQEDLNEKPYYDNGSAPGLGSFLYLFNYCIITGIIIFITWVISNFWIAISIISVLYIMSLFLLNKISNRTHDF